MQKLLFLFVCIYTSFLSYSQQPMKRSLVYVDAASLKLIGQAFPLKHNYSRIDTALHKDFRAPVKRLLTHSAGLAISFKTNSPRIAAKWCVTNSRAYNNMTPIMNKGLDLYIKRDGVWQFAGAARPGAVCNEYIMTQNMDESEKECLIYLPLYDAVTSISVGVDSGYTVTAGEEPFTKKRIVIYGSSVTQGASASRPGLAYPARLSRDMGINFINLGLSGNGVMEKEVADMVANIQADAFILDCFANPSPEQISERTAYLVKAIRAKHPAAPIIMIQSIFRETGNFDSSISNFVRRQHHNTQSEFEKLKKNGVKNLYLIPGDDLIGNDHEATTDGLHPNDLGFDRMLKVIKPALTSILY